MTKVQVTVQLKDEILDVQGRTIAQQSVGMGYKTLVGVGRGSVYFLKFNSPPEESLKHAAELAKKLLSNPLVETFDLKVVPEAQA